MDQYRCPCCGGRFNGKKCRSCLYESFEEEIAHRLHLHKGEPLVIKETARRPIPKRNPFACDEKTKKPRLRLPKWMAVLLTVLLLNPLLLVALELIESIGDRISVSSSAAAEPDMPHNVWPVYSDGEFTVYLAPQESGTDYPVFFENLSDRDVCLMSRRVVIDGFVSEQSSMWCETPSDSLQVGNLWISQEDLNWAVTEIPCRIEVDFVIFDADSYEDILEAGFVIESAGTPQAPELQGETLIDGQELKVAYLGYLPDAYDPENFSEGELQFYLENRTPCTGSIYSVEALINGEPCELAFWCELPGETRTVTRVWLYDTAELGIKRLEQVDSLKFHLASYSEELGSRDLGWVTVIPE